MIIKQIFPSNYPNNLMVDFNYTSDSYFETKITMTQTSWTIDFNLKSFQNPLNHNEKIAFFQDYKDPAEYYLAEVESNRIVGWMCIGKIEWKNTARLWEFYVSDNFRNSGIGKQLLKHAEMRAKNFGSRALEIETQTSNSKAIKFYLKNGYCLSGVDSICYSNNDIEKNEVRIELVKKF